MKKQLYDYQQIQVDSAIRATKEHKTILVQTPTGGGKTVMFSFIAHRFMSASTQDVIIYVHRRELAKQTRQTIFDTFGISAQLITAGMRSVPKSRIYIAMVESAKKRMPSNIGLAIIDEAHIASLHKAHTFTENVTIIAFSATPISANKKQPLKDIYQLLVSGPQINDLIERGKLCQNITIAPKDVVDRNALAVKGGDFNDKLMGNEFSKAKHVKSTLTYYEKFLIGKKTLIFNCNIDHSIEVTRHFKAAGYNIRHLDSENCSDFEREETLRWLKHTPDAIVSSVAILTTGFDEPSVIGVIVNRSIMSLSLWLQITGRGGRTFAGKEFFYIIDMGANAVNLGDWSYDRDWLDIFENPPSARKTVGVAPCKSCPTCEAIIAAQASECKYCGYVYPAKKIAEEIEISEEYKVLTKGIDVERLISSARNKGYKDYASFYEIGKRLLKNSKLDNNANQKERQILTDIYINEVKKWCEAQGKKYNGFHKKLITEFIEEELSKLQTPILSEATVSLSNIQPITNTLPSWLQ